MANSNIVTIANSNYYKFTERMIQSLRKTTQHNVLLFCDNAELFAGLQYLGGIEVIELASIKTHGIYRARFDAYNQAIKQGSFLYLDSDIIILEDISELLLLKKFSGCADDMSACSFIENKQFPWKDKNLENTRYINTGVFFAPQGLSPFFDEVYQESLDDAKWATYGDPILADNHFLNAYLNKHSIDIYYIDEYTYNWQGFIKGAELQVRRDGDHLYNIGHGNLLKVAHFAGIKTNLIESFIKSMPIEISNLLKSKVSALSDEEFFVQNIIESYKIRRAIECSPYEISGIDVLPIEFNDGTLEGAADN
ncbi:MAG: hypothetical protein LBV09_06840, partial [Deferribacteraceae bacterium]|nr:hypothetical protein [Deferribacteraceae bacterium]